MTTTPYQFIRRGNLFITPVGPSIAEVPYPRQSLDKPPEFSLWVHGEIVEPGLHMDRARMATALYREVRDDLTRYSPVEVTRSAIRRSSHAYVGVIDSRGTPYYFALDSRGVSVREAPPDAAWKAFDRIASEEDAAAVRQRRADAAGEMLVVARELSEPAPLYVAAKALKYGKKVEWRGGIPHSTWWRNMKNKKPPKEPKETAVGSDEAEKSVPSYASEYRRVAHELWLQTGDGESELDPPSDVVGKALPRKSKETDAKKTPSRKASKKQGGAGGKTRYTYPQEKSGGRRSPAGQVPLVVVHDDHKRADPAELADQLGVSVRTLRRTAERLGSDKFKTFMRSRLKTFATKHRLDPDYWGTLYASLMAGSPDGEIAKSDDAAWKQFGDNVNEAAAAVPRDHPERYGDRKVFIHHVHAEMKRHGTYSGNLDEFKEHVMHAHKNGHVTLSRADLVGAMNPRSVEQSNTEQRSGLGVATFNFVNAEHDPKLEAKHKTTPKIQGKSRRRVKADVYHEHDAANGMSSKAREATEHAEKMRTPETHIAAMTAHHRAGVAHQSVSGKVGDKTALAHFDQSMAHLKASKASG